MRRHHGIALAFAGCLSLVAGLAHAQVRPFEFPPLEAQGFAARAAAVAIAPTNAAMALPGGGIATWQLSGGTWQSRPLIATNATVLAIDESEIAVAYSNVVSFFKWNGSEWDDNGAITFGSNYRVEAMRFFNNTMVMRISYQGWNTDGLEPVLVFVRSGTVWNLMNQIPAPASGVTPSMDRKGPRMVVAANTTFEIREQAVGPDGWGVVRNRTIPSDLVILSVALAGDRCFMSATDTNVTPAIRVYTKDAGGVNQWGLETILLPPAPATGTTLLREVISDGSGNVAVIGHHFDGPLFSQSDITFYIWFYDAFTLSYLGQHILHEIPDPSFFDLLDWFSNFSSSAALSAGRLFTGLPPPDYEGTGGWVGRFYQRSGSTWNVQQAVDNAGVSDWFGFSVAMTHGWLVAGMPYDHWNGHATGSAYVWNSFSLDGDASSWRPVARLHNPNGTANDFFGYSVAIGFTGGYSAMIAVGAPGEGNDRGAVYLYEMSVFGNMTLQQRIQLSANPNERFGESVAFAGEFLAIGAPGDSEKHFNAGAIYVLDRNAGGPGMWGSSIKKTSAFPGARLGTSLAGAELYGVFVAGGVASGTNQPGLFVFYKDHGGVDNWGNAQVLRPPPEAEASGFGYSVAMSMGGFISNTNVGYVSYPGDVGWIVAGADAFPHGRAYVYRGTNINDLTDTIDWELWKTLGGTPSESSSFGWSVAASLDQLVVGEPDADTLHLYGLMHRTEPDNFGKLAEIAGPPGSDLGRSVAASWHHIAGGAREALGGTGQVWRARVGDYERWADALGPSFVDWLPHEDADGDGDANLMEFLLGTDPQDPASFDGRLVLQRSAYGVGAQPSLAWINPPAPYRRLLAFPGVESTSSFSAPSWTDWQFATQLGQEGQMFTTNWVIHYSISDPYKIFRMRPVYPVLSPAF